MIPQLISWIHIHVLLITIMTSFTLLDITFWVLIIVIECFPFSYYAQLSLQTLITWISSCSLWVKLLWHLNFIFKLKIIAVNTSNLKAITINLSMIHKYLSRNCVGSMWLWIYPTISLLLRNWRLFIISLWNHLFILSLFLLFLWLA